MAAPASLFSVVQGSKPRASIDTLGPPSLPPGVNPPMTPAAANIPGRAAGGDVQLPDMYAAMAGGAAAAPQADQNIPAAPAPAPSGGNAAATVTDPLAPILMQIAQQYNLIDANGQPDLEQARQIYMQNPSMYQQSAGAAGLEPQSAPVGANMPAPGGANIPAVPGQLFGGEDEFESPSSKNSYSVAGYGGPVATTTPTPGPSTDVPQPSVLGPNAGQTQSPYQTTTPDSGGGGGDQSGSSAPGGPSADDIQKYLQASAQNDATKVNPDYDVIYLLGNGDYNAGLARWNHMTAEEQQFYRDKAYPGEKGSVRSADAAASLAQQAAEFQQTMAFNQEKEAHAMAQSQQQAKADQEKAMQDFYNTRDALVTARKQLQANQTTSALNAWTANVGKANVPGFQNWRLAGGAQSDAIQAGMPVLNFNPLEAYGKQLSEPVDNPAPNIPGVDYSQAA